MMGWMDTCTNMVRGGIYNMVDTVVGMNCYHPVIGIEIVKTELM